MSEALQERPVVLVADDDESFRALLQRFLEPRYTVLVAGDGEEALQAIEQHRPAVVLTDVLMPKLSGIELIRAIRSRAETRQLPVILLVATAWLDDLRAAQGLQVVEMLPKESISRQSLLAVVARCLGAKSP